MKHSLQKYWPILLLLLWLPRPAVAQGFLEDDLVEPIPLLSEHRFAAGGYSILVVPETNFRFNKSDSESVPVYFDQVADLERISQQIVAYAPAVVYPFRCFDSHQIFVCKNGVMHETLVVSDNCHAITASEGEFHYDGFFPFQDYRLARRQVDTFADPATARKERQERMQLSGLLLMATPQWLDYDGEFGYYLDDDHATREEVHAQALAEFKERFPGEPFELSVEAYGHSPTHPWNFRVLVKCRQSLFDRFGDLHEVDWGGWKPYALTLESYWKAGY
jgi:hypothetical protein